MRWELLFLGGHRFPNLVPFFIDWLDTPHPATTNPRAGLFRALEIRTPDADSLNGLFEGLGMDLRAEEGDTVDLVAEIDVAGNPVRLGKAPGSEGWTL